MNNRFSHLDTEGRAKMVDVSQKSIVKRTAKAGGYILLQPETVAMIREGSVPKGDIFTTAKLAGIMAAKRTSELIPLCHPIMTDAVNMTFTLTADRVMIESTAVCRGRTGIEMEVLTAVSVAALTIYDMCKAVDTQMEIGGIHLIEKKKIKELVDENTQYC
ncbi:MAG: cyclic pyranopterin monophosphate synthase MoaC [Spirochaetia bacterium]|nr:cyclic pyranopterin monophosphate synthase MoaC [Spirochaetia bacterium]